MGSFTGGGGLRGSSVLFAVMLVVAACTSGPQAGHGTGAERDPATTGTVAQKLSTTNFVGTSVPAKTLALTFDDGPGPRTAELSQYLKSEGIKAGFFVNGARVQATALPNPNGIDLTANAAATLAQLLADGHLVANHTTSHRDLQTEVPDGQRVQEVSETDSAITGYVSPASHLLFRAPYGSFGSSGTAVYDALQASTMKKYIGPIFWDSGGFAAGYPSRAADWACWQGALTYGNGTPVNLPPNPAGYATTKQCGDAYLNEIHDDFPKGIVLMHDPYSWSKGSTVDMVKYLVPILKAEGYSFIRIDEVPTIAAALPCDDSCMTCSGPNPTQCTSCAAGKYLSGGACTTCGTCAAGHYPSAACTATTDVVCGTCHASCTTCSGPAANQCGSCPAGFFIDGGACAACATCAPGSYQAAACTPLADTSCMACPAGQFAAKAGALTCTACGTCDDADACTTDSCHAASGCVHAPIAGCTKPSDAGAGPADAAVTPAPDAADDDAGGSETALPESAIATEGEAVRYDAGCSVAASARGGAAGSRTFLGGVAMLGLTLVTRRRRRARAGRALG